MSLSGALARTRMLMEKADVPTAMTKVWKNVLPAEGEVCSVADHFEPVDCSLISRTQPEIFFFPSSFPNHCDGRSLSTCHPMSSVLSSRGSKRFQTRWFSAFRLTCGQLEPRSLLTPCVLTPRPKMLKKITSTVTKTCTHFTKASVIRGFYIRNYNLLIATTTLFF
jgi:hypothetical protein